VDDDSSSKRNLGILARWRNEFAMRDHILREIRRIAAENGGQAPGQKLFVSETGIGTHQWRGKFWARWGDEIDVSGFSPNQWTGRLDSEVVLTGVIGEVRQYGRMPTRAELSLYRSTEPNVPSDQAIRRHFGGYGDLVAALAKRAREDSSCTDIAAILPAELPAKPARSPRVVEGFVYLFQSGEFYKIGQSKDLERRVKEVRVALPHKMEIVHSIRTDDPPGIEAYWHRRFAEKRANGEWFRLTSADVMAFKKRKYQ
jgi:hypothetical protein